MTTRLISPLPDHCGSRIRRSAGFNLVELMVAMAVGSLLLAGAISIFVNNKATYEVTTQLARMQEDARYALDTMVYDLRMAGYVGCVDDRGAVTVAPALVGANSMLWDARSAIEAADDLDIAAVAPADVEWMPSGLNSDVDLPASLKSDSDAITLRYFEGSVTTVTSTTATQLTLDGGIDDFEQFGLGSIADCLSADVFQIDSIDAATNTITTSEAMSKIYPVGTATTVGRLIGVRYYVADYSYTENGETVTIPSLFRREIDDRGLANAADIDEQAHAQLDPLIQGVEMMQISYGVDSDNDGTPNRFVPAENGDAEDSLPDDAAWSEVVAVQIALLVRTSLPANQPRDPDSAPTVYTIGEVDVQPSDEDQQRFQYRTFQTTTLVRNLR